MTRVEQLQIKKPMALQRQLEASYLHEKLNAEYSKMPKLKTVSGAAKRFKKTSKGYKHRQSFRNHILTKKSTKRKRHLRGYKDIAAADVPKIDKMLGK